MSAGTVALIGWLAVLSLLVIVAAAAVLTITGIRPEGGERLGFPEAAWESLMRTLDAGTMGADAGWGFRAVMFVVTLAGVFVVSSLIGVLTSGLESKMGELRKGRSFVNEQGHTLILGWSPNVFAILSELVQANANQKRARIVVLADKDKVEMEDEIRAQVGPTGRTQIICRTGSPIAPHDLEIVNPRAAKSVILLSPGDENPDAQVIKSMLALSHSAHRRPTPYHIVAEIQDPKNLEVARLVGKDAAQFIVSGDFISRITVQTCRQSGMSVVYTELLDFEGDEIYFQEEPALVGKAFGEALLTYDDCAVLGLRFAADGRVRLNPPQDTVIRSGDRIIAIAQDDDRVRLSNTPAEIDEDAILEVPRAPRSPERTLILGWNRRGCRIIQELDTYVAPGSEVTVVATPARTEQEVQRLCPDLRNQEARFRQGNTTDRATLDSLQVCAYDHVIVLDYSDTLKPQEADAQTLITLLHLRAIVEAAGKQIGIVSEMQDVRNVELAQVARIDDFIVSERLISLMLAQVSENRDLNAVFAELLGPEGSEIYLNPAASYVTPGHPVNFYTVVEAARRRGEVAIGYRRMGEAAADAGKAYGVVVNPKKSEPVTFAEADRIIVLAEA